MKFCLTLALLGSIYTVGWTQSVPSSGLYFMLNGTVYLPGDTIFITDIGTVPYSYDPIDPGLSLVCVTTNINTQCCRKRDGGNVGEWYLPDGTLAPRFKRVYYADFSRSGHAQQVRLNRRNNAMTPTGAFECRVPNGNGVNQTASIILSTAVTLSLPTTLSMEEEDGKITVCVTLATPVVTVADVSVELSSSDGTATAGTDYEALSQQLIFFAGTSTGAVRCVDVSISNDNAVERDETFTVRLTSTSPIATFGNNQTTINILDSDTTPPSSPTGLTAYSASTSIALTWSQPPGEVVDSFLITYSFSIRGCPSVGGDNAMETVDGAERAFTLDELEENSDFVIGIRARNARGESQLTSINAATTIAAPSSPPADLKISSTSPTSITITWNRLPCEDRNSEITRYGGVYHPTQYTTIQMGFSVRDISNREYTAMNLIPRTNYTFQIAAATPQLLFGSFGSVNGVTDISSGVMFFSRGILYANNSAVVTAAIGQGVNALYCLTNLTTCCTSEQGGVAGEWILPADSAAYTTSRTASAVLLNRIGRGPSGIFTCRIPDGSGQLKTVYIGVDTGAPVITGLEYNLTLLTLTCTSRGGPVDSFTWLKEGVEVGAEFTQTQSLLDPVAAVYQHTLSSNTLALLVGDFMCVVRDTVGNSDSRTLNVNGLTITTDFFTVGGRTVVTCSSDTGVVDRMQWLSGVGLVLATSTSIQQLDLTLDPVIDNLHGSEVTCSVTRDEGRANQRISTQILPISVTVPPDPISAIVSSSGSNVAGSEFTLTCVVTETISGLTYMPTARWLNADGGVIVTGGGITIATPAPSDRKAVATLTFNSLRTSHGKAYKCIGSIPSPALNQPRTVSILEDVGVQISPPKVSLSVSPGPLIAGGVGRSTLICSAMVNRTLVDVGDIEYGFTWQDRNGFTLLAGGRIAITNTRPSLSSSSSLTLFPLSATDTSFSCTVTASDTHDDFRISETVSAVQAVVCPIGMYLVTISSGSTVCLQCPPYSASLSSRSSMCTCFQGYYRNQLEDVHSPCTRPPSACHNMQVLESQMRADSITVTWEHPVITGRDDYYYEIHHSDPDAPGNFIQHNINPLIPPLARYTVSGLRPNSTYAIRVRVVNGVSDQDPSGEEERHCEVTATTGDIYPEPPRSVTSLCTVVVWQAPRRAYGVITGYDIAFLSSGAGGVEQGRGIVTTKKGDKLFHIVEERDLTGQQRPVLIQVRAKTDFANGIWSELVPLNCTSIAPCPTNGE